MKQGHSIYDWTVNFVFFCRIRPKIPASMTIRLSVDCKGPKQHNGAFPMFIRCMVLEIELFV